MHLAAVLLASLSVLAAQEPITQEPVAKIATEADHSKAMKELQSLDRALRDNIEEVARADLERMLLFQATMDARRDAARIGDILAEVAAFWEARKDVEALALSRDALQEAANISKALAVIDLHSPSVATIAQEQLGKVCTKCHAARRERLPDGRFQIRRQTP